MLLDEGKTMSPDHLANPLLIEFIFFGPLCPARNVVYITLCGHPLEPDRDLEVSEEEVYLVG